MTCEGFALARFGDSCPQDINQRIESGLGPALHVLGGPCTAFNFNQMVNNTQSPTSNLPVLFSSSRYRSPNLEQTIYPTLTPSGDAVNEYWFGLGPWGDNTLCARSGARLYCFRLSNWTQGFPGQITSFRSVPGVMVSAAGNLDNMTLWVLGPPELTYQLGSPPGNVTDCQMSGDGLTYFLRTSTGWKEYDKDMHIWEDIQPNDPNLWLVPSFDGKSIVQTHLDDLTPGVFHYKIGSASMRVNVADGVGPAYGAVLGSTVFIARDSNVYTVGSLNFMSLIHTLPSGVATGIWADDSTVWIATTIGTYMSNDAGWTWSLLENEFAVGPGLFTKPGSANIWTHSDETFAEAVGFPLRLTNGGLLFSPSTGWRNGFEDKTMTSAFTEILATTTAALSPNGLYLYTNAGGVITLYLNAWNSQRFADWCTSNDCRVAYARYCQSFGGIDPRCDTDTPGGPDIPVTPSPSPPATTPGKGLSTLAIVMIVLGVLALLVAVGLALSRKNKITIGNTTRNTPANKTQV